MKFRKLLLGMASGALLGGGLLAAGPATAASAPSIPPSGGACVLSGTANFAAPGLTATGGNFSYSFTGTLTKCQSNDGAPSSGTVSAGVLQGSFQEPVPTGSGGCAESTTSGTAIAQWADGNYTVISYQTTGVAAAVELSGTVVPSVTLTSSTGTETISTNEPSTPVGSNALGELTFGTTTPQACSTGLSTASINGLSEIGQA